MLSSESLGHIFLIIAASFIGTRAAEAGTGPREVQRVAGRHGSGRAVPLRLQSDLGLWLGWGLALAADSDLIQTRSLWLLAPSGRLYIQPVWPPRPAPYQPQCVTPRGPPASASRDLCRPLPSPAGSCSLGEVRKLKSRVGQGLGVRGPCAFPLHKGRRHKDIGVSVVTPILCDFGQGPYPKHTHTCTHTCTLFEPQFSQRVTTVIP